jgi:anti-anti-sigma factor
MFGKEGPALEKHDLTVTVETVDDVPVIRAVGELEIATVPEMRAKVTEVTECRPRAILFDFRQLSYLDSSGLGILVSARKRLASHGGEAVIITAQPAVLKALSLSGLDQIMRIYATEEEFFGRAMAIR